MANFRLSLFFLSPDDEGFSENYYWTGSDITSAQTEMNTLIGLRKVFLPTTWKIVNARASDVATRGNVLFTSLPIPVFGTYTVPTGQKTLTANTALLTRFGATPPRYARFYMRGLSSAVVSGREKIAETTFDTAFAAWANRIVSGSYLARHRLTPPPHATYSYSPITTGGNFIVTARKPGRPFDLLRGRRT